MTFAINPIAAMEQSYIGTADTTQTANLFSYSGTSLPLTVDNKTMIATASAEFGYQCVTDFKVSRSDSTLYTFINDLFGYPGIEAYFNTVDYNFSDNFEDFEVYITAGSYGIGGGNITAVPVCLTTDEASPFCTIPGG